jgi:hypothetical protein
MEYFDLSRVVPEANQKFMASEAIRCRDSEAFGESASHRFSRKYILSRRPLCLERAPNFSVRACLREAASAKAGGR